MYHSVKSVKKRRKRRALLLAQTILALLLAVLAAFVLEDAEQESPAGTVTVAFRGRLYRASSGQTVRQTLKGLGLSWDEADVLSAAEDTVLERGMVLTVDRVEQRQEVYTQVLPAGTVYCRELSLPEGTQALLKHCWRPDRTGSCGARRRWNMSMVWSAAALLRSGSCSGSRSAGWWRWGPGRRKPP